MVRRQLSDLGTKINQQLQPAFTSKKIADHLRCTEDNPTINNWPASLRNSDCRSEESITHHHIENEKPH